MDVNWKRSGLLYLAMLLGVVALATVLFSTPPKPTEVPLSEAIAMSHNSDIKTVIEEGEWLTIITTNDRTVKTRIGVLNYNDLRQLGFDTNAPYEIKPPGVNWGNIMLSFLPVLALSIFIFFVFFRARGVNNQALSFGRSRARLAPPDKPQVTFDDVAGVDEAKQELYEVVEFLKAREKFQTLGARIPRGVLLVGPPGTGKTLLARAIAGEAGVPFFSISGSEFVEMFVGVGASRVRDLFDQAKKHAPCIVFVDEIDAVGRQRGAGLGGSHDEREQTLNQILTEMDGFDTNTSVIVLAATNRPDILDPALLRPGRFDRRVVLDRPDQNGRVAILKVHIKNKPMDKLVNLETLAKQTVGFSGADLANLVNEAAILAARRGKKATEMIDLEESIDKVLLGPERKSHRISPKEKEITAYHEAGHALVAHMMPNIEPVRKISIIPRGLAGGYTKTLSEDKEYMTRSYIEESLAMAMGGRAAEELIFNDITTGAQADIKQATTWARRMVTDYGMSDKLGPRTFGDKQELIFLGREISEQKDYGDKIADVIDEEVDRIIGNAQNLARKILLENKPKLIELAQKLLAEETLEGDSLDALFGTTKTKPPEVTQTLAPAPIEATAEPAKQERKVTKPSIIPLPNQAPAPSDG
ncbi:MAG TPA: ATP-dependent zinc metalloprotease FtsH [Dehalococcoidales bacterium]|nr:ATP-dependent zinc metalloprotease FtsH [Dehalococcoidales bacterium]